MKLQLKNFFPQVWSLRHIGHCFVLFCFSLFDLDLICSYLDIFLPGKKILLGFIWSVCLGVWLWFTNIVWFFKFKINSLSLLRYHWSIRFWPIPCFFWSFVCGGVWFWFGSMDQFYYFLVRIFLFTALNQITAKLWFFSFIFLFEEKFSSFISRLEEMSFLISFHFSLVLVRFSSTKIVLSFLGPANNGPSVHLLL